VEVRVFSGAWRKPRMCGAFFVLRLQAASIRRRMDEHKPRRLRR
jgi:hypothetical protein